MQNITAYSKSGNADNNAAKINPENLSALIELSKTYETGLYWQKIPVPIFITKEEEKMVGFEVLKEHLHKYAFRYK